MARYESKPQALVDYAGIIGLAWLRDASGRLIAASLGAPPSPLGAAGLLVTVPGAACTDAGKHEVKIGGYALTILSAPGISPYAVTARLEGCRRLLRALSNAPLPWLPPGEGQGGSGPANAELRVWPPSRRQRSS